MQSDSTDMNKINKASFSLDFNATAVLLGLSIVNKAKQQLKEPLSTVKLTMNQWLVLKILYLKRAETPTGVAKSIDADPTTISRHLDSLEARGLIERKHDQKDRRVTQLQLTQEGVRVAQQVYKRYTGILQNLDSYLNENQQIAWKKLENFAQTHAL